MTVVHHIESCLFLLASNQKEIPVSTEALHIPFVDALSLDAELKGLPTIIGLYNATADVRIKEVTKVSTLCDIFNQMQAAKVANPQIHKLLNAHALSHDASSNCFMRKKFQCNEACQDVDSLYIWPKPSQQCYVCSHSQECHGPNKF